MARIPEEELERLKREVPLQQLVEASGVVLKRRGNSLLGLCPFHEDKNPSLSVTPSKNLFRCFGCGAAGSVIDWVKETEKISFRHAVELLQARFPGVGPPPAAGGFDTRLPCLLDLEADDRELLRQVVGYYHETLKQSPEALSYLEKRAIRGPELVERFQLGYSNRTLGYRLPRDKDGRELRERLRRLGVFRKTGHEHFDGCIVAPIFGEDGQVLEMYGRKSREQHRYRPSSAIHLYLPGRHRGVWNLEALESYEEIILCEALIDSLTFYVHGYENVTWSYGTQGFTPDHLAAFKRHGVKRVLIAYDRDESGDRAAAAVAKRLGGEGIGCFRVRFPLGQDANSFALEQKAAKRALGTRIRHAVWLGNGQAPELSTPVEEAAEAEAEEHEAAKEAVKEEKLSAPCAPPSTARPAGKQLPSFAARAAAPQQPEASPLPPAPAMDLPVERSGDQILIRIEDRLYRVLGLEKCLSPGQLRVNLRCTRGEELHADTLDLCVARRRMAFARQASELLGVEVRVLLKDLGKLYLKLEEFQHEEIQKALAPKVEAVRLSDEDRREALEVLRDPNLLRRIVEDFGRCGLVGEELNKLTAYLAGVSRKLDRPLGVIVQSSTAAGKSSLMDAVLSFLPEEEVRKFSALTQQALFYMAEADLKHKVLAIVEEEGAQRASYPLKLLLSEGELSIASTGKDPATGQLSTQPYRVEGPVALLLTTTSIEVDQELENRCMVLTVNEGREQTQAIQRLQREQQTLEGYWARQEARELRRLHQNMQRLLQPLEVFNPYARELSFLDEKTRTRRDHEKYLTLIRAITLLHQHQRPLRTARRRGKEVAYIEVRLEDIEVANWIANQVLGHSLDELPPQSRRLLMLIEQIVSETCERLMIQREEYRFSRRDIREYTGWGNTQLKVHLRRLEEMEYLLVHRGRRGQSFVYELLYEGQGKDGRPFVLGLPDVEELRAKLAQGSRGANKSGVLGKLSGSEENKSGSSRPQVGVKSAPSRGSGNGDGKGRDPSFRGPSPGETVLGEVEKLLSSRHTSRRGNGRGKGELLPESEGEMRGNEEAGREESR